MSSPLARAPIAWQDIAWILLALLVLVASGIGLRDPWPADEPRFAAVARDMVASGDWLFPRVGGDLYQDKPPLFMWLIAAALSVTGSLRLAFLLPSLLAAGGTDGMPVTETVISVGVLPSFFTVTGEPLITTSS